MTGTYSLDFRTKVVEQYNSGEFTQEEISTSFGISISTIKRWLSLDRNVGNLEPRIGNKGRPNKISAEGIETIKSLVEKNNAITLFDLSRLYYKAHKVKVGRSILSRALKKLNMRRKKLSILSSERDKEEVKKKD